MTAYRALWLKYVLFYGLKFNPPQNPLDANFAMKRIDLNCVNANSPVNHPWQN